MIYDEYSEMERKIGLYASNREGKKLFKEDLFDTYKLRSNPKAESLFYLAWDYGHSEGYSEVLTYFSEMVELIR